MLVVSLNWSDTFETIIHFFLSKSFSIYVVDGPKVNLIICLNVLMLLCKDHVNIHAALNMGFDCLGLVSIRS